MIILKDLVMLVNIQCNHPNWQYKLTMIVRIFTTFSAEQFIFSQYHADLILHSFARLMITKTSSGQISIKFLAISVVLQTLDIEV